MGQITPTRVSPVSVQCARRGELFAAGLLGDVEPVQRGWCGLPQAGGWRSVAQDQVFAQIADLRRTS
ncbi:hypothetical protein AWB99_26425 [Mycolicibacterium confluentis]|nr:hypothetical protein AWB99_26425 [Mycolicibacterium confluentis]